MQNYINYSKLLDEAMRSIVAKALDMVAMEGLIGDHHFFISFTTNMLGVKLSERMREKFPEEITIVLQYEFENLTVEKNKFSVVLTFDGFKETVIVPFTALTAFSDPSVGFALQFTNEELELNLDAPSALDVSEDSIAEEQKADVAGSSNIIALDKFRKKKK